MHGEKHGNEKKIDRSTKPISDVIYGDLRGR